MPVDPGQLKLDPYQSQVPLVQIPQQDLQPGGPLPHEAGYMGKAGGIASIGDQVIKGFLRGHEVKAQKQAQLASTAVDISQRTESDAYTAYQEALRTGAAKAGDTESPQYKAYLQAHQAATQTMQKYAVPDDKKKSEAQKQAKEQAKENEGKPQSFGEKLKSFMAANPHFIPELAIAARTPKPPSMSADTEQTKNTLESQKQGLTLQGQQIDLNKSKIQQDQQAQQDAQAQRQVAEAGGYESVLKNPNAPPELQQAARREKFTAIDKMSPEGQMKLGLEQKIANNQIGSMTPGERQLAGGLGLLPDPKMVKITGKNGHEFEVPTDPTTGQPLPGAKPIDLGPPQWAQEFYGERAAKKRDLERAVASDPASYGITLTGDKKADQARIDATSMRLFTDHEEGLKSAASGTGKTLYETSRDNTILSDVAKELKSRIPGDKKQDGKVVTGKSSFTWPGEKGQVPLSRTDAASILNQFVTSPEGDHPGIYTFRDKPELQTGKDAGAAERDRQWAYQLVKDRMMAQKGKNAMSAQQADAVLGQTALGKPITADEAVPNPPVEAPKQGKLMSWLKEAAGIQDSSKPASDSAKLSAPPTAAAENQAEPPEGSVARDASGTSIVYVNGQWLNQETMQPYGQ